MTTPSANEAYWETLTLLGDRVIVAEKIRERLESFQEKLAELRTNGGTAEQINALQQEIDQFCTRFLPSLATSSSSSSPSMSFVDAKEMAIDYTKKARVWLAKILDPPTPKSSPEPAPAVALPQTRSERRKQQGRR